MLSGMGDLMTVDIDEAEALNAFLASNPHWWSPRPLCLETGFKENYQQWKRIESGVISRNFICANPWDQMGCIKVC